MNDLIDEKRNESVGNFLKNNWRLLTIPLIGIFLLTDVFIIMVMWK
jgi:hypothetical protein